MPEQYDFFHDLLLLSLSSIVSTQTQSSELVNDGTKDFFAAMNKITSSVIL